MDDQEQILYEIVNNGSTKKIDNTPKFNKESQKKYQIKAKDPESRTW